MSDSSPSGSKSILTEGIFIALGTAFVYLVAFVYEAGYCSHFGVPLNFISPNITTILVAGTSIGFVLFTSMQVFGFSIPLIRAASEDTPFRRVHLLIAIFLIFGALILRAYGFFSVPFYALLGVVLFFFSL